MRGLEDQVAVVTGGGGGIGRKICIRLAEEGARVAVLDIDARAAEKTVEAIGDTDGARAVIVDITNPQSVRQAIAGVIFCKCRVGFGQVNRVLFGFAINLVTVSFAFVADSASLRVLDVRQPSRPRQVTAYKTPGALVHDLWATNGTAYLAAHQAGLMIFRLETAEER